MALTKIQSVEELDQKIEDYFKSCHNDGNYNNPDSMIKPYTMAGLALALGISRRVMLRYRKDESRKEFHPSMQLACARIEAFMEERLFTAKTVGGITFALKNNFGWKDQVDIKDVNPRMNLKVTKDMSAEEAADLYEKAIKISNGADIDDEEES